MIIKSGLKHPCKSQILFICSFGLCSFYDLRFAVIQYDYRNNLAAFLDVKIRLAQIFPVFLSSQFA